MEDDQTDHVVSFKPKKADAIPTNSPIPYNTYNKPKSIPNNIKPRVVSSQDTITDKAIDTTTLKEISDSLKVQTDLLTETNTRLVDVKNAIADIRPSRRLPYITGVQTIPVSTPQQPPDVNTITDGTNPGYSRQPIWEVLNKNSDKIYVVNLGPGQLFVIYSSDGSVYSQAESFIDEGAVQIFYNCFEIRLRSPTAGCQYQLSQTEIPLQRTSVVKAEKIETYSTISTINFTGTILFNTMQTTNLGGLLSNKYFIRGVNMQSIQPLDYDLLFFGSNVFDTPGNLDTDTFLDSVEIDFTQFPAFRINNITQWRLSVTDINIMYEDQDSSNTLHMGLLNLSPTTKNAGPTGAVQLDIKMSPRI